MVNIYEAPFIREMCEMTANMYRMGWDERNGGNISYRLDEAAVLQYLRPSADENAPVMPLGFSVPALAGQYFIVTGTGSYFRNVEKVPQDNMGIIRVNNAGDGYVVVWGYENGGAPTSELPTHLKVHAKRQGMDPRQRVVLHCHPANVMALTFVHELDDRAITRTLWRMHTECMVVFPEGVGVVPWMVCGNSEIGEATAKKIEEVRVVIWGMHGIFGVGNDLDEALGLVETVEKAAEVYCKIMHMPMKQSITDAQLKCLAEAFGVTPRAGYLDV